MKKARFLKDYCVMADSQAERLQEAIDHLEPLFPLTAKTLETIEVSEIAFFDMFTTRFGKLQDILGTKIFPLILDLAGENDVTFLDRLHKLEKMGLIEDAHWWMDLRELRNQLAHDYPNESEHLAKDLNTLLPLAKELLVFWTTLKEQIKTTP